MEMTVVQIGNGTLVGFNARIIYDWFSSRRNGNIKNGNGKNSHDAPCEFVKELQIKYDNHTQEILQRLTRIETLLDDGNKRK